MKLKTYTLLNSRFIDTLPFKIDLSNDYEGLVSHKTIDALLSYGSENGLYMNRDLSMDGRVFLNCFSMNSPTSNDPKRCNDTASGILLRNMYHKNASPKLYADIILRTPPSLYGTGNNMAEWEHYNARIISWAEKGAIIPVCFDTWEYCCELKLIGSHNILLDPEIMATTGLTPETPGIEQGRYNGQYTLSYTHIQAKTI